MKYNRQNQINEATTSQMSGKYKVPVVLTPQLWDKKQLGPFTDSVSQYLNAELAYEDMDGDFNESPEERRYIEMKTRKMSEVDRYLKQFYNYQNDDDGGDLGELTSPKLTKEDLIKEDLAVWFGTKKKPKGSKQPKGPWVDICRKDKNGKHPPCGRSKSENKGYPKCRAAGVAGKMSDSQKKSACQQKRQAEKTHTKIGTGNKPKMVKYEPKKNKNLNEIIQTVLNQYINNRSDF